MAPRKFKVVMVAACPFPANHGSPASIREMSECLVALGHTVHILTYPTREDIPVTGPIIHRVGLPFLRSNKVKVGPTPEKFIYDPLMALKLIWLVWRYKIDVIHAHNYEGALIGWIGKLFTGRPMLYNAVNTMADELASYDFFWSKRFANWLARLLDKTIPFTGNFVTAVSDSLKAYLVRLGVRSDKIQVLPAGVNPDMFPPQDKLAVRQRYGYLPDDNIVIYTGSFDRFQRLDYLIDAVALLKDRVPRLKLLLAANIANPKDIEQINQHIARQQLGEVVEVLLNISLEQLPDYLALADVATVPRTDCPGHPVKILNYLAARVPIVSFVGAGKGLHHLKNAYLAEDHKVADFADGLAALLADSTVAGRLAQRGRETVETLYSWQVLAQGIAVIYQMLCSGDYEGSRPELNRYILDNYESSY